MSKGLLLYANQETMTQTGRTVHTLSLPVSSEMAPTFKVLVYHVTEDGEVLSDAITLPVEGIGSGTVSEGGGRRWRWVTWVGGARFCTGC